MDSQFVYYANRSKIIKYLPRIAEKNIREAAGHFPVVLLTGPRQSGKTTTLQRIFAKHRYVSLDEPVTRMQAEKDPALFLADHPAPVIIDEIPYVPGLLPLIKLEVDRQKRREGQYVLTGSQAFPLMQGITESLAGRAAIFELLPLCLQELPGAETPDEDETFVDIIRGFYPGTAVHGIPPARFYNSYIQTYLERDIRMTGSAVDLQTFQQFIEILAANTGQILNMSKVGAACGISHSTVKRWISILEASRLIYLLQPYSRNLKKRVVKSPKLYFTDTGIVASILRESNPRALRNGVMGGALFENAVIMDLVKKNFAEGSPRQFHFYRDNNQAEADLIISKGSEHTLIEIKLSRTPTEQMARGLRTAGKLLKPKESYILCTRKEPVSIAEGVKAMHWFDFVNKA